ncbi:MAG: hypothetical protein ACK58T_38485, partial [Phycisphaerae bacterium]
MEKTVHRFVLRHGRAETAWIVALTLASLPIYYLSLDIPKTIINKAIIGKGMTWPAEVFIGIPCTPIGISIPSSQVGYLFFFCGFFLLAVLLNGGLKQYINT